MTKYTVQFEVTELHNYEVDATSEKQAIDIAVTLRYSGAKPTRLERNVEKPTVNETEELP